MSYLLQYLIKFSISLAVLYIFYRAVLRPLTFYMCNRFYLLCYAALSFIIPFVNITPWVVKGGVHSNQLVNIIPVIGNYTVTTADKIIVAQSSFLQNITLNQWLVIIFCLGAAVMLVRIIFQYLSLRRIRSKSILLNSSNSVHLYQTSAPVSPFSFGNAIYFNSSLHNEEELQRIIQHEFVHVKQKHSVDILMGELLCIVNWFNPFAWFIRHAIRQNLEFIADNDVIANGLDKKEYQYLLLKVVGIPHYSIANNFNFSSLKKRIAMMNKMKSAKLHLTKFLFVLPLMVVLLLAFRNKMNDNSNQKLLVFTGIIYDTETLQPLPGATVSEKYSAQVVITDANGYFKIKIPITTDSLFKISYDVTMKGFGKSASRPVIVKMVRGKNYADLIFAGLDKWTQRLLSSILTAEHQQYSGSQSYQFNADPDYAFVQHQFSEYQHQIRTGDSLAIQIKDSKKPIWWVDKIPYTFLKKGTEGGGSFFDKEQVKASPEFIVWLDGKLMSIDEANAIVNRFELNAIGTCPAEDAIREYGVNKNVIILYWKTKFSSLKASGDTIPSPPIPPVAAPDIILPTLPLPPPDRVNKKGYTITVADNNGECIVLVKDKKQKIVKAIALTEWNKNKKENESQYGEVPPAPPPAPAQMREATEPVAPAAPSVKVEPSVTVSGVPLNTDASQNFQPNVSMHGNLAIKRGANTGNNPPLYVIDGKELNSENDLNDINPNDIHEINVWKDKNAIDKYGDKGKNGVIEIRLKKNDQHSQQLPAQPISTWKPLQSEKIEPASQDGELRVADSNGVAGVTIKKNLISYFPADAVIILDGKQLPAGVNINDYVSMDNIDHMTVSKGKPATDKYGNKVKNGLIEIKTKKQSPEKKNEISATAYPVVSHFDYLICNGSMTTNGNESFIDGSFSFANKSDMPLLIVDGNEILGVTSFKAAKARYRMLSLNVKQGIAKYGDNAKFGALEINRL